MTKIAHASIDERGKISGGTAGDQTGKEVCIRDWYNKPWNYVLRLKDEKVRYQFANNMIDAANNNKIGYDQKQRNTILTKAEAVNFDFAKIATCECDCSSLISAAVLGAIYKIKGKTEYEKAKDVLYSGKNLCTTSTLRKELSSLGLIHTYNDATYTKSEKNLVFGDICVKEGSHVVCAVDNGKKKSIPSAAKKATIAVDGVWGTATTKLAQKVFKTTVDGKISRQSKKQKASNPGLSSSTFEWVTFTFKGSALIRAIQKWCGTTVDGQIGPKTIKAMQKKLGTPVDGKVSNPSQMVKAFQKWLNAQ